MNAIRYSLESYADELQTKLQCRCIPEAKDKGQKSSRSFRISIQRERIQVALDLLVELMVPKRREKGRLKCSRTYWRY